MEENHKLIAKIQHFYEVMQHRINDIDFMNITDTPIHEQRKFAQELSELAAEYSRVFEAFLYTEPQ